MRRSRRLGLHVLLALGSGVLWQAGCTQALQNELEVLFAAQASPTLIRSSWLVKTFGPGVLTLFNNA